MYMTDREGLIKQNPETVPEKITQMDLIASAEDPSPIFPNSLKMLKEIYRVLKRGGILYLSVPDKRYTFESERPVTSLSHVQKDHDEEATVDTYVDHYKEWADFVECRKKAGSEDRK